MATMPNLGERRVARPARGIASVDLSAPGRALEQVGQTLGRVGDDLAQRQNQERDAAAVSGVRRQIDDWERATLYDPQNGAVAKLGRDSFDLPNAVPKSFDDFAAKIPLEGMSPRARSALQELIASRRDQALQFVDRHAFQQRQVFDEGQFKADIDSSLNRSAMLTNAGDLPTAAAEVKLAQSRAVGYLKSRGRSEEEIASFTRDIASRSSVATVNMLLDKDRPVDAEKYLRDNAGSFKVEDLLRAQGAVGKAIDARQGLVIATEVVDTKLKPAVVQSDFGRLSNLAGPPSQSLVDAVKSAESGGRRYGPDGKLLQGPMTKTGARAQGEMQVMPATYKDPGYGIKPADLSGTKEQQADEIARVGREKLGVLLKMFGGDVPKALAAYNAGEGRVQKALEQSAKGRSGSVDWLSYMPQETQAYVAKITKQFGAGEGAPTLPTLASLHEEVRTRIPADQPQRRKLAMDEVTHQYDDQVKARKQIEDQNYTAALDWLEKNNGNFAGMPAKLRANLPPGRVDDAMTYSGKIAAGMPVQTDWNIYTQLRTMAVANPQKFAATDLRHYYPQIGPTQREQLVDLQTKANDPKSQPTVISLERQLSVAHGQLNLMGNGNAAERGMFDNAVTEAIAADQRDKKRDLTFEERDKIIKRMQLPTTSGGWFKTDRVYQVVGTSEEAGAKIKMEDEDRKLITSALKAEGLEPTEAAIKARFNLRHGIR